LTQVDAGWHSPVGQRHLAARNLRDAVAVRDSKNPDGPVLTVSPAGWRNFIADVKAGRRDLA
jgi:Domain of unknown function (DUF397)